MTGFICARSKYHTVPLEHITLKLMHGLELPLGGPCPWQDCLRGIKWGSLYPSSLNKYQHRLTSPTLNCLRTSAAWLLLGWYLVAMCRSPTRPLGWFLRQLQDLNICPLFSQRHSPIAWIKVFAYEGRLVGQRLQHVCRNPKMGWVLGCCTLYIYI